MPSSIQSPEIQAFATGFPITLMHFGVTVAILFAAAPLSVVIARLVRVTHPDVERRPHWLPSWAGWPGQAGP